MPWKRKEKSLFSKRSLLAVMKFPRCVCLRQRLLFLNCGGSEPTEAASRVLAASATWHGLHRQWSVQRPGDPDWQIQEAQTFSLLPFPNSSQLLENRCWCLSKCSPPNFHRGHHSPPWVSKATCEGSSKAVVPKHFSSGIHLKQTFYQPPGYKSYYA